MTLPHPLRLPRLHRCPFPPKRRPKKKSRKKRNQSRAAERKAAVAAEVKRGDGGSRGAKAEKGEDVVLGRGPVDLVLGSGNDLGNAVVPALAMAVVIIAVELAVAASGTGR